MSTDVATQKERPVIKIKQAISDVEAGRKQELIRDDCGDN